MKIKVKVAQPIMQVKPISPEEAISHSMNAYNPKTWADNVRRMLKFKDVEFYDAGDDVYVVYTIPEGIRFIRELTYSSCIHNGGFNRVYIRDGKVTCERPFANHPDSSIANNPEGRKWMAHTTASVGAIYSNDLPLSRIEEEDMEVPDEFYEQFFAPKG